MIRNMLKPSTVTDICRKAKKDNFLPIKWSSFLIISLLCSCSGDEATIPAYLSIPEIQLVTDASQGSDSEKIEYAFTFVNGEFIGGYELPVKFPVLASEPADIVIEPGVKANGLNLTPDRYPFYKRFEANLDFAPERTLSVVPTTSYKDNVMFAINEEFEGADHLFSDDLDGNTNTTIEIDGNGAFEGKSAKIVLDEDNNGILVGTDFDRNTLSVLPANGTPVWMEIDYKTDVPIIFGLTGVESSGESESFPEFGVNSKSEWNKIYFDMTSLVNLPDFVGFQLFFGAELAGEDSAEIYLDNIKVLYFQN